MSTEATRLPGWDRGIFRRRPASPPADAPGRSEDPFENDPIRSYGVQKVRIGVQATLLILVVAGFMLLLFTPELGMIPMALSIALLVAATLGVGTVLFVPWERIIDTRFGLWCFYAWSVFDIMLITLAIGVTGDPNSELFFLYCLTTALFAVSYPPRTQAFFFGLSVTTYLLISRVAPVELNFGTLFFRLTILGSLAVLGHFLSRELNKLLASQHRVARKLSELDDLRSDFLSTVSHELRTPLAAIGGFAATLSDHGPRIHDELRNDLVSRIGSNAQTLDQLIRQLLDFSRGEQGQLRVDSRPCEVSAVIRQSITRLESTLSSHPIEVSVSPGQIAMADPDALARILDNLLTNAAKFSAPGTPIIVRTSETDADIVVSIQDRGVGLPPDEAEKIFDRFYRVKRGDGSGYAGTGIGLAIVKQFVEAHGGRVWVDSTQGAGSTFSFTLPRPGSRFGLHAATSPVSA